MIGKQVPYYPAFLNIRGRKCVVAGGGPVALRKAKVLLEHGADVTVLSPELCSELTALAEGGRIRLLRRHYQMGDLQGAFMAIAATDDSRVNQQVTEEARRGGVLVNVVDDAESSDFIVPSLVRRGDITIAISTAGKSPALARKIRARLEKDFGKEFASLALLIDEVRTEVKQQGIEVNGDGWQEALDLDLLLDLLKKGNRGRAKAILLRNLKRQQK